MSKFEFDITYIKGELNKVADCLSRYFENDTSNEVHELHEYVQADRRIDPDGEDLPKERYQEVVEKTIEIRVMQVAEARHSQWLREAREQWNRRQMKCISQMLNVMRYTFNHTITTKGSK